MANCTPVASMSMAAIRLRLATLTDVLVDLLDFPHLYLPLRVQFCRST